MSKQPLIFRQIFLICLTLVLFGVQAMAVTTITVGASGANFTTIQAAYNSIGTVSTPTEIVLQSTYAPSSETYPITLGAKTGASAVNTITIKLASEAGPITIAAPATANTTTTTAAASTTTSFTGSISTLASGYKIAGLGVNTTVSTVGSDGVVTLAGAINLTAGGASFTNASWLATNSSGTITSYASTTTSTSSNIIKMTTAVAAQALSVGMLVGGRGILPGTTVTSVADAANKNITISTTPTYAATNVTTYFTTTANGGISVAPTSFQIPLTNATGFYVGQSVSGTGISSGSVITAVSGNNIYVNAPTMQYSYASGATVSTLPTSTVNFNGAQYVYIDGGSKSNLIIENPNTLSNTITLQNGASNNKILNCTVKGVSTSNSYATILVGSVSQTSSNNNNLIDNCDIRDGATKPLIAVSFMGASGVVNTGNTISNCNIYNVGSSTSASVIAMYFTANSSASTTIDSNKIYWTSDVNDGAVVNSYYGILARGEGNIIKNNVIGYKAIDGTGTFKLTSTANSRFIGIKSECGTSYANRTIIDNNTISNITLEVAAAGTAYNYEAVLTGIIGNSSSAYTGTYGEFTNNKVQNLKLYNSAAPGSSTYSLYVMNIFTANTVVTGNVVDNIIARGGTEATAANYQTIVRGIQIYQGTGSSSSVASNKVSNIVSGDASITAGSTVHGIFCGAEVVSTIEKNKVYNVSAINNAGTAITYGLVVYNSSTSTTPTYVKNNIVRLGTDNAVGNIIHGIYQQTSATGVGYKLNVYNNTVYLGGTVASGTTGITSTFTRVISAVDKLAELKNNILVNVRTGGTTGKHFAINLNNATDYSSSYLASNYNIFQIGASNNAFGLVAGAEIADFNTWKSTCTSFDANSYNSDPQFNGATASVPDLTINPNVYSNANAKGADLSANVSDDYTGATRSGFTPHDIGAYAFNSNILTLAPTTAITAITTTSAATGGQVTSDAGNAVSDRGICMSTNVDPTILDTKISNGSGVGTFSINLSSLTANTTYNVRAFATNGVGTEYATNVSFVTLPAATTSSAATAITANGFTANWTAPTQGAATFSYTVEYGTAADLTGASTSVGIASSNVLKAITGLTANTQYYYRVKAVNASGAGVASEIQTFLTLPGQATITANASNKTATGFTALWNAPTGQGSAAFTYNLDYSTVSDLSSGVTAVISIASSNLSYALTGLNSNTQYSFRVKAVNATGAGTLSTIKSQTTLPAAPTVAVASSISATGFTANWTAPTQGAATFTYTLEYSTAPDLANAIPVNSILSSESSSAISSLTANTSYYYRVKAVNAAGSSAYSDIQSLATIPVAPTSAAATSISATGFTANWTAPTQGAATFTYTLQYSKVADLSSGVTLVSAIASTNLNSGITGLTPSTTYYYRVKTVNASGESSYSDIQTVATAGTTVVDAPISATDMSLVSGSVVSVASGGALTIDQPTSVASMEIATGGNLIATESLTVNTLTFNAGLDGSTFSAKIDANITATTVRLLKTIDNTKWYFMSFPYNVVVADITKSNGDPKPTLSLGTGDLFIKYYDGGQRGTNGTGTSNWKHYTGTELIANHGYIFGLSDSQPVTTLSFPLKTGGTLLAETADRNISVDVNNGPKANDRGWNLIGQPFLSKFIGSHAEGSFDIYVYDEVTNDFTPYTKAKVPNIKPFSAYFVQASASLAGSGIIFNSTSGRQLSPSVAANDLREEVQIDFNSSTGSDYALLRMDNSLTNDYEVGSDLEKWIGTTKPQIYTILNGINYAFNALPMSSVVNLPIGFYTKTAGSTTISVNATNAPSISKLILTDNSTNPATEIDLLTSSYTFTAGTGINNSRFSITAQRVSTDNNSIETASSEPQLMSNNSKLIINNLSNNTNVRVFDAIGRMIISKKANSNTMEIKVASAGLYTIQLQLGEQNWTKKVIVK
jgi:hypothetical protein